MMRIFLPLLLVSAASAQISFGPSVEISDVINLPVHVQAVDMDADGDPDILAAEDAAARALWWENDGDGHFSNRREWLGDIQASVISLADHDGDSIPDIWLVKSTGVPEGTHESMVARGQPGGTFAAPVPILTTAGEGAAPEVVADVNGDGRLDLVATGGVALRQADGSFAPLPVIAPADVNALAAVAEFEAGRWDGGDFAGSSAPEIVFRDGNEPFSVFLTTILADGSVGPRTAVHSFPEDEEIGWLRALPPEGPGMRNRLMVAVRQPATETPVTRLVRVDFPAEGPPAVTNLLSLPQLGGFGEDIYGSLWDEAGQRVLLTWGAGATEPDSRVSWISPGAESPVLSPVLSFTGYAPYPLLADLDGDETEDLLMPLSLRQGYNGRHVDHLVWHPGLGAGAFEASPNEVNQPNFSTYLSHAGDLDGDGDGDMVTTGGYPIGPSASNYSNQLIVWRNDGGSFTREVVAEDRDWIQVISTGDFNGDTRADLLVQTFEFDLPGLGEPYGTQRIYRLIQQPGGSFLWTLVSQEQLPRRDLIVADVDWDRDGLRDLLVQRNSGAEYFNTMVWLPGTATGYGPERFILSQW